MHSLTPYPITPIGNLIGVILALLPLIGNIRKLNRAVWGYAIWIAIYDATVFVNTIIWHDNVDIVVPVWCDIVTRLQLGSQSGTRACTLVICIHLYRITRLHGVAGPEDEEKLLKQRRKVMALDLLAIIGLPIFIMVFYMVVQPIRFQIYEELGCDAAIYSYVGYIIQYGPLFISSACCAFLAPLTLRTFLRHRREMIEFLSSDRVMTHNKYHRLIVIVCLDTFFNLPVLIVELAVSIAGGKHIGLNYPYVSWENVHDGMGGNLPGLSISSILQVSAAEWSADKWQVFVVKWNEWIYVLHAFVFFCVFGTTPELRSYYRAAFWWILECFGCKREKFISETETGTSTVSDAAFRSDADREAGYWPPASM